MDKEKFGQDLENLDTEIRNIQQLDDDSRDKLSKLASDIQQILKHEGDASSEHHNNLTESLKDSIRHFEVSHPRLTAVMSNLINTLGDMGI